MNSAVNRQQWLRLSDVDPAAAAEAVARLKANQQTLERLDFEMAQRNEVASRNGLGLLLASVVAACAVAGIVLLLPLGQLVSGFAR